MAVPGVQISATVLKAVRSALGIIPLLLIAVNAFAAKTDVVVLRNGDRFTGEVKELSRGQLKLATDDVGTIYIEWDKIVAVTTALQYEVVTHTSSRYVGVLAPESADQLRVIAASGSVTRLAFLDVVSFFPIKSGFLQRIDGSFDVGGTYTKSSGVGQTMTSLVAVYRRPAFHVFSEFESNVTRESAEPLTVRFTWRAGYTRYLENNWFVSPFVFMERNPDLGLTLRTVGVMSAGRYLHRSNRSESLIAAGLGAGREHLIDGEARSTVDGLIRFTTSVYQHDYPRTTMDLSVMVFPELTNWGRVRSNVNAKIKRELFRDFFLAITMYDMFDSHPQVSGVDRNDVGVSLSIGWTF